MVSTTDEAPSRLGHGIWQLFLPERYAKWCALSRDTSVVTIIVLNTTRELYRTRSLMIVADSDVTRWIFWKFYISRATIVGTLRHLWTFCCRRTFITNNNNEIITLSNSFRILPKSILTKHTERVSIRNVPY